MRMKKLLHDGDIVSFIQIKEMLLSSIKAKSSIDRYQLELAHSISPTMKEDIEKCYMESLSKSCPIGDELKRFAFSANIDHSTDKDDIYSKIEKIYFTTSLIVQATLKKKQTISQPQRQSVYEFIGVKGAPPLLYDNQSELNNLVNSDDGLLLTIYTDDKNRTWCFTEDMYAHIIKTKSNPYTEEDVSPEIYTVIRNRNRIYI